MNRRGFLRSFAGVSGGLVVTATMAEAGALADFMSWLKRAPAWSFPSKRVTASPLFNEMNAATLEHIRNTGIIAEMFNDSPFLRAITVPERIEFS